MRRNAAFLLGARLVSAATTLIVLALVARLRGPDALGAVGLGFALGAIAATVSDLGLSSLTVREGARDVERTGLFLGSSLLVRLVTIPLGLLVVLAVAAVVAPAQAGVVGWVAAGLVAQQTAEATRSVFNARQRMAVSAGHTVAENVGWSAVIAAGLVTGAPLDTAFAAGAAALAASVLLGLVLAARVADVRPRVPDRSEAPAIVRMAMPFAAFNAVGMAYSRIDTVLIAALLAGPALVAAGAYFAASRLVAAFEYLPEAIGRATYPELSRRTVHTPAAVAPLLRRATAVLLVVGGAVPPVLIATAPWVMATLFAESGAEAGFVLAGLSLVLPLRFLGYLYGTTLTSADAQGRRAAAAAVALAVVVVVNVVGLPHIGVAAPVLGALAAAALLVGIYGRSVVARFGAAGVPRPVALGVAAGLVLATGAGVAAGTVVPSPLDGVVAAGVYVAVIGVIPGWRLVLGQPSSVPATP